MNREYMTPVMEITYLDCANIVVTSGYDSENDSTEIIFG